MTSFLAKPWRWAIFFSFLLVASSIFVLLDTFVIPKSYQLAVEPIFAESSVLEATPDTEPIANVLKPVELAEPIITENSYKDENISITLETLTVYDTTVYLADIQINDISFLQTALAQGVYGRNIKATTSDMAAESGALFAINGDYYGFRDNGFVIRNGILYRETSSGGDALVIDKDGNLSTISEDAGTAQDLLDAGALQVFSFGPSLLEDGSILVEENEEVLGKSKNSNPRTAIGQVGDLHYLVIVSDGRTDESKGLSLYQLAQIFKDYGATTAYNLDGGGSSTMVFNGNVVNKTTNGRSEKEREVSDIVYIGYEEN